MSKREPKVMVYVPSTGAVDIRWCLEFYRLLGSSPPGTMYGSEWHYGVAETREMMAEHALDREGVTHIFFLDSDVIAPENAISELLKADKPIVAGIYFNSLATGLSAWVDGKNISMKQDENLVLAERVGLGCCLIDMRVFEEMKDDRPWFYYNGSSKKGNMISEDFYFFDKCSRYGIRPYVDMRVKCQHVKQAVINVEGQAIV